MNEQIAEVLRQLSLDAASTAVSEEARQAAKATGGLPVLTDMGGVLVLTPAGEVFHYEPERGIAKQADERWRTLALVKAALKHPELRALMPERPPTAMMCNACHGTGVILGTMDCGTCMGTGWLT
jgi:hypothetical protein